MINLKTKGYDNAAAVLGGYDALVKAGLPVETGKPKASSSVTAEKKLAPARSPSATTPTSTTTAAPAKHSKRRGSKTRQ